MDGRRSRRFPITVPLHNLRSILCVSDVEGLAQAVSAQLQERVAATAKRLWSYAGVHEWPPMAAFSVVRVDRASVRMGVRATAAVAWLVSRMQRLGWPPAATPVAGVARSEGSPTPAAGSGAVAGDAELAAAPTTLPSLHGDGFLARAASVPWLHAPSCGPAETGALPDAASPCAAAPRPADAAAEPRERLQQLRPHGAPASPGASLPADDVLSEAAARELCGLLPEVAPDELAALVRAAQALLHVAWAVEPGGTASIAGRQRWSLLLHKQCVLLAHVARHRRLCGGVAEAYARLAPTAAAAAAASDERTATLLPCIADDPSTQTGGLWPCAAAAPDGDRGARVAPGVAAPARASAALLARLPRVPEAALAAAWPAASAADATLALTAFHPLVPAVRQAAALRQLAPVYALAQEVGAALADWQDEPFGAGGAGKRGGGGVLWRHQQGCGEAEALARALLCAARGEAQEDAGHSLVRYQLHVECLRAWAWCAFLLGVDIF